MSNLKDQLIRLGYTKPELRGSIRPILDRLASMEVSPKDVEYTTYHKKQIIAAMNTSERFINILKKYKKSGYFQTSGEFGEGMSQMTSLINQVEDIINQFDSIFVKTSTANREIKAGKLLDASRSLEKIKRDNKKLEKAFSGLKIFWKKAKITTRTGDIKEFYSSFLRDVESYLSEFKANFG